MRLKFVINNYNGFGDVFNTHTNMVFDFVKQVGNHLQKDLTKFGYRLMRRLQKLRMNLLCFGNILELMVYIWQFQIFFKKIFCKICVA